MPDHFTKVFESDYFLVEQSNKKYDNNDSYYRINEKDSVICCVLDQLDRFILVEQNRPAIGLLTLEFPAGQIENNEQPLASAEREFYEETSLYAKMSCVGKFSIMPNRSTSHAYGFFGFTENIVTKKMHGIKVLEIKRGKLEEIILSGKFQHMAGLAVLKAAELYFEFNIFNDKLSDIEESFIKSKINKD
jgi:8-oxo-dGTP pyrophosphatase MutT (NUDIX family)